MINELDFRIKKNGEPYSKCYCRNPELIENYDKAVADTTQMWECHHRLETYTSDGERRLVDITMEELITLDMYYHRPAEELIFLTAEEHTSLHKKGKHHSEEALKKMSDTRKGERNPMYGKHHSEEAKRKNAEAHKGEKSSWYGKHHSDETKIKMSESWDYEKHFSDETKRKLSEVHKGKHWKIVDGKRVWY